MTLLFLAAFGLGAVYLLLMMFSGLGDALDIDSIGGELFGGTDGAGEAAGIGCNVIAGFLVAFGAIGLAGSIAEWNIWLVLVMALVFGAVVGRMISKFIRFIYAQQSDSVGSLQSIIGTMARVTINSGAGQVGEAMIEHDGFRKIAIKEVSDSPLVRGDVVQIISQNRHVYNVKKKHHTDDTSKPLSDYFEDEA
jgi:membrane-bound ClpP family serine protease